MTKKGLIIIGIPLFIQVAFLLNYQRLLAETDDIVAHENRAKNVIGRLNWISTLVVTAELAAVEYRGSRDKKLIGTFVWVDHQLRVSLADTAQTLSEDARESKLFSEAASLILGMLKNWREDFVEVENKGEQSKTKDTQMIADTERLVALRHEILAVENERNNLSAAQMPRVRHAKRDMIAIGIAIDALLAVGLFYVFSQEVTKRLAVLIENVDNFSKGGELKPLVPGRDEVAVLDRNFHEMAEALSAARQRKQEYLQMICHDLRTPIANVVMSLELMRSLEARPEESGRDLLGTAERNLRRALGLINQILEIERMESGMIELNYDVLTSTELCTKAREAVESLGAKKQIAIEIEDPEVDFVADTDRLIQVLVNLLGNAIKFSEPKSTIKINCRMQDEKVTFAVIDQGRGIPPSAMATVFNRFQQVDSSDQKSGSGLGLAVCKAIIEAHHGQIGVESTLGQGSKFWFTIPAEPEPSLVSADTSPGVS